MIINFWDYPKLYGLNFQRQFLIENNIRFPEGILAEDLAFVVHSFLKANGIVYIVTIMDRI